MATKKTAKKKTAKKKTAKKKTAKKTAGKTAKKQPAKKARTGGASAKGANRDVLVVGSKVKAYVRGCGAKSSSELISSLSEQVYTLLDRAINRAQENRRSTVHPKDL